MSHDHPTCWAGPGWERHGTYQEWPGELPLETSTEFITGQQSFVYSKHAPLQWDEECHSPAIPARRASNPDIYETVSALSLSDSPMKQPMAPVPPPRAYQRGSRAEVAVQPHQQRSSLVIEGIAQPAEGSGLAAVSARELERANEELSQRVQELQEKLATAEKPAPAPSAGFHISDQEEREWQKKLAGKQREMQAAQQAVDRARTEAKSSAAQLQLERGKNASLLDEVAQWRDEYTKMKKECNALRQRLEAMSAHGSLLDSNVGVLKKQNAELLKAAAEKEAASRALHDKLQMMQGHDGNRHRQLQQVMDQAEALRSENAALRQQLQDASAEEGSKHSQMQQLWDDRERLYSENSALRHQVQELDAELQHMADAFAAARSQMREHLSRESSGRAVERRPPQHSFSQPAAFAAFQAAAAAPAAAFYQVQPPEPSRQVLVVEERPSTVGQLMRHWPGQGPLAGPGSTPELDGYARGYRAAAGGMQQPQQELAPPEAQDHWQQSVHAVRPETAAAHERWGEAAPPPPALRSLSFDAQQGAGAAEGAASAGRAWHVGRQAEPTDPSLSPCDPAGLNPRASLTQPYHMPPFQRASTPEGAALPSGSRSAPPHEMTASHAEYGYFKRVADAPTPSSAGSPLARPRRSSTEELSPLPDSVVKAQRVAAIPFGNEDTLQEMLGRTQVLEERLMKLGIEKNDLEAEYARCGKKITDRKRKVEVEQRLEAVQKEISNIRLTLKKLGYK